MKITFQTGRVYRANIIERGDKHDQSIVHLLSTLPSKTFLVENKDGSWSVTTGQVIADAPVKIILSSQSPVPIETSVKSKTSVSVSPAVTTKTKSKQSKQPKKKKR